MKKEAVCYMLVLRDPSKLSHVDSSSLKLSSLNESHLALVNRSWKFGCEDSKLMIKNMILNFPSCCVLDSDDQPVVWILNYASSALGMLYTLPEHRGKGFAKALVAVMSKKLHSGLSGVLFYRGREPFILQPLHKPGLHRRTRL